MWGEGLQTGLGGRRGGALFRIEVHYVGCCCCCCEVVSDHGGVQGELKWDQPREAEALAILGNRAEMT